MDAKEFNKISIKDICGQAGINRSTYYYHYYEQKEVLQDIIEDLLHKTVDVIEDTTPEELRRALFYGIYQIRKERRILKIILSSSCESEYMHAWNDRWLTTSLSSTTNAGEPMEYRVWYANCIFYVIYGVYRKWILEDCRTPEEEICRVLESAISRLC